MYATCGMHVWGLGMNVKVGRRKTQSRTKPIIFRRPICVGNEKKNNTSRQTAKTRVTDMQRPLIDITCSHSTLSCSQSLRSQSSFPSWPSFLSGPMCGMPIHSLQPTGIIPPPRQFTTIHLTQIPFEDVPRSTSTVTP